MNTYQGYNTTKQLSNAFRKHSKPCPQPLPSAFPGWTPVPSLDPLRKSRPSSPPSSRPSFASPRTTSTSSPSTPTRATSTTPHSSTPSIHPTSSTTDSSRTSKTRARPMSTSTSGSGLFARAPHRVHQVSPQFRLRRWGSHPRRKTNCSRRWHSIHSPMNC